MRLKALKKIKHKKTFVCLLAVLVILVILVWLVLYKPGSFRRQKVADIKEVSPYLTHKLLPDLYNNAQREEPFDLVVVEEGINDIIAHYPWPKQYSEATLSAPVVSFRDEGIELAGIVAAQGVEFLVTLKLKASLDEEGLLRLAITSVKIGAVNITPLARIIIATIYQNRLAEKGIDPESINAKIAASLLEDQPFKPIFLVEDKKVRIEKITFAAQKLTLRLVPVPD